MTSPVTPPAAPVVPLYPPLGSATFNADAYAYGTAMPGVVDGINDLAGSAFTNATAAYENASSAASSASTAATQADLAMGYRNTANAAATAATDKAAEATASALSASKLNLGNKASPPTTDNQGAAILAGATYYDTTLNKWRVWTGAAWGDGISAVAGVSSVAGKTGVVTLAKADVGLGSVDNTADNVKAVLSASKLTTARTINGKSFDGSENVTILGNPTVTVATGGVMDCSAGDRFTLTVSGNVTLSFTNIPSGSYACVLEVNRTAGTITFPAGTVWPGVAPTLAAGRHLFYFERAQLGTAGWYASSLTGYSA